MAKYKTKTKTRFVHADGKGYNATTVDIPDKTMTPTNRNNYVRQAKAMFRTLTLPAVIYKGRLYDRGEYVGGGRF